MERSPLPQGAPVLPGRPQAPAGAELGRGRCPPARPRGDRCAHGGAGGQPQDALAPAAEGQLGVPATLGEGPVQSLKGEVTAASPREIAPRANRAQTILVCFRKHPELQLATEFLNIV